MARPRQAGDERAATVRWRFAKPTAARLASVATVLDEMTPMQRATIRQHAITTYSTENRRIYALWLSPDRCDLRSRLPIPNIRSVMTELCRYRCEGCGQVLTWAYVDGKDDGGPECPTCMRKYWEAWHRTLAFIFNEAVRWCRTPTDYAMTVADGLLYDSAPWNPP